VESITRADIEEFHRKWFHPDDLSWAVSGDFDRDEMVGKTGKVCSPNWPFTGEKTGAHPDRHNDGRAGIYIVDKDVNQGRVSSCCRESSGTIRTTSTCW